MIAMETTLIGLDTSLPRAIIGCDPGPTHCAFALVICDGQSLTLYDAWYVPVESMLANNNWSIEEFLGDVVEAGIMPRTYGVAFEKVTTRYGAVPGATTYDTCRNSGIVTMLAASSPGCRKVYAVGTVDWRVALGGSTHMSDAEVRRELTNIYGDEAMKRVARSASQAKKQLGLDKPCGCHMRDAAGVVTGLYLMRRHGTPASARLIWEDTNHA